MGDSKRWLREHFNDHYVKKAQQEGYPSRAAYKLLELQLKDKIFRPGMTVVDLGAAPGGWSKVARECIGDRGLVVAVDLLPMVSIPGVEFIQGDFNDDSVRTAMHTRLTAHSTGRVDVVMSDMAPNISGLSSLDQPRALHLAEIAWEFAKEMLSPQGVFVIKIFQGQGTEQLIKDWRAGFEQLKIRKPASSRSRSREFYVVARGLR